MSLSAGAVGSLLGLDDLACPICVETIEDAFVTPCGHTFCYKCISTHLKNKSNCPSCGAHLIQDHIHPNFLLRKLIKQAANNRPSLKTALLQHVQQDLAVGTSKIPLQELDSAIRLLQERRQQVATHEGSNKLQLLLLFLQHAKAKQQGKLSELEQQLEVLQQDLDKAHNEQQQQQEHSEQQEDRPIPTAAAAAAAAPAAGAQAAVQPSAGQVAAAAAVKAAGVSSSSQAVASAAAGDAQQQQTAQQQPAIGGAGSAFRRLPQPISSHQQQQQQPPLGMQQPVQAMQQQQPPSVPQQQQQQPGFRPVGLPPMNGQGFRPFVPQQRPMQPQQQQQQQQQQQLMQPQQQPQHQQVGFRPYGSYGGIRIASSAATNAPMQQQQQQQQQHSAFKIPHAVSQGVPAANAAAAAHAAPTAAAAAAGSSGLNVDKKRKILQQFDELQQAYMNTRVKHTSASTEQASPAAAAEAATGQEAAQHMLGASSAVQTGQKQLQQSQDATAAGDRQQQSALLPAAAAGGHGLAAFSTVLAAVTSHNKLEHVAYIPPSSSKAGSGSSSCNILSSIAFDCQGHLFAAAGVQQRICIYDYDAIMATAAAADHKDHQDDQDLPHPSAAAAAGSSRSALDPLLDLPTRSKISCTSFNPAVQHYLLSSDYEGLVHLWDLNGGRIVRQWEAHEKRIWAVDSCPLVQDQFATGSDDGYVKIWGLREPPVARATLPVKVNVCSLEYNPLLPHLLAVGSAGHQVHIYDLRMPRATLATLRGHRKAVSYVRWAGAEQLVTASTDSTLRLWAAAAGKGSSDTAAAAAAAAAAPVSGGASSGPWPSGSGSSGEQQQQQQGGWHCAQVFRGHTNMKHFVGLSTHGQYIACGSETNEVFVYHQGLPTPSLQYRLAIPNASENAAAAGGSSSSKSPFVSAVTWRGDSDMLLAANSQGGIWVLSLAAPGGGAT